MCLVSVLPKGKPKFDEKVITFIKNGMSCNGQGSGYMFKRNGESVITIDKGYFNVEKLLESIKDRDLGIDDELVVHHRISTSGLVSAANSHPFVISNDHDEVCATDITINKPCLAHNGMFSKLSKYMELNPDFSDTYAFSRYVLGNPVVWQLMLNDLQLFNIMIDPILSSSRIAILFPDRDVQMVGDFRESDGYFHSNYGYCRFVSDRGGSTFNSYGYYGGHTPANRYNKHNHITEGYGIDTEDDNIDDYDRSIENAISASPGVMAGSLDEETFDQWRSKQNKEYKEQLDKFLDKNGGEESRVIGSETYCDYLIGDAKVPLLVMDNKDITLTSKNYHHFYIVPKKDFYEQQKDGTIILSEIDSWNYNKIYQLVNTRQRQGVTYISEYESISTIDINDKYYYIVKKSFVNTYEEFIDIVSSISDASKQTLKKLTKLLDTHYNKEPDFQILYDKLDRKFSIRSLIIYKDYLELELKLVKNSSKLSILV